MKWTFIALLLLLLLLFNMIVEGKSVKKNLKSVFHYLNVMQIYIKSIVVTPKRFSEKYVKPIAKIKNAFTLLPILLPSFNNNKGEGRIIFVTKCIDFHLPLTFQSSKQVSILKYNQ